MIDDDTQALTVTQPAELSVGHPIPSVVARFTYLRDVLAQVMRKGADYGPIPGCGDKDSLFKSGAEKLCTAFGLAPRLEIERRELDGAHREYEVKCTLVHIATGATVAEGVGTCSTMESRYRWRRGERTCPKCHREGSVLKSKNPGEGYFCWRKKDGCGATFPAGDKSIESQSAGRVENADIADAYNTVLKIAKKRAQVDATLTAVGASDLLTQDLEDLGSADERDEPRAHDESRDREPPARRPQERATEPQTRKPPAETSAELSSDEKDLISDIDDAATVEELRTFASKINGMPRGPARRACKAAYDERLAKLSS